MGFAVFACRYSGLRPRALKASIPLVADMEAAQAHLKAQARLKIEEEVAGEAPGISKPFFVCCGGPVGTVEKCMCMVAAEKQDNMKKAIEKYRKL